MVPGVVQQRISTRGSDLHLGLQRAHRVRRHVLMRRRRRQQWWWLSMDARARVRACIQQPIGCPRPHTSTAGCGSARSSSRSTCCSNVQTGVREGRPSVSASSIWADAADPFEPPRERRVDLAGRLEKPDEASLWTASVRGHRGRASRRAGGGGDAETVADDRVSGLNPRGHGTRRVEIVQVRERRSRGGRSGAPGREIGGLLWRREMRGGSCGMRGCAFSKVSLRHHAPCADGATSRVPSPTSSRSSRGEKWYLSPSTPPPRAAAAARLDSSAQISAVWTLPPPMEPSRNAAVVAYSHSLSQPRQRVPHRPSRATRSGSTLALGSVGGLNSG